MKYDGPGPGTSWAISSIRPPGYSNGVAAHTLYLTVSHRAEDNGLDFGFEYQTGVVTPEKLEYIYYYLCRINIPGCGRTRSGPVGEIIEMGVKQQNS